MWNGLKQITHLLVKLLTSLNAFQHTTLECNVYIQIKRSGLYQVRDWQLKLDRAVAKTVIFHLFLTRGMLCCSWFVTAIKFLRGFSTLNVKLVSFLTTGSITSRELQPRRLEIHVKYFYVFPKRELHEHNTNKNNNASKLCYLTCNLFMKRLFKVIFIIYQSVPYWCDIIIYKR